MGLAAADSSMYCLCHRAGEGQGTLQGQDRGRQSGVRNGNLYSRESRGGWQIMFTLEKGAGLLLDGRNRRFKNC
jgi:hypothetical protein